MDTSWRMAGGSLADLNYWRPALVEHAYWMTWSARSSSDCGIVYEIIEAETGEEGVRLAQERHPSMILMDIRLPGIDGIEALRRLRAEQVTREIPIMAMTASVMTADRQRITDAGFDAFQSKPIKVKDFVAAVERLLDHPGK
jgi:CheY-like chemotaxis protein